MEAGRWIFRVNFIQYLEYNVLVAVAIGAIEWVDAVSGGRPVQDNWLVRRMSEVVPNLTPLRGEGEGEGEREGGRKRQGEREGGRERKKKDRGSKCRTHTHTLLSDWCLPLCKD